MKQLKRTNTTRMFHKRWFRLGSIILLLVILIGILGIFPTVSILGSNKYLSLSSNQIGVSASEIPIEWWLDSSLNNGLWYEDVNDPIFVEDYRVSFMKIYSLSGTLRVMEVSTYPRAYKDTSTHMYTEDTPFTVTQDDCTWYYDDSWMLVGTEQPLAYWDLVYLDLHNYVWKAGDTAYHYIGEPLPGIFPDWIESEYLPLPSWVDSKKSVFPTVFQAVKGEVITVSMYSGYYREKGSDSWAAIPTDLFNTNVSLFQGSDDNIKVTKLVKNKDYFVLRIIYDKIVNY